MKLPTPNEHIGSYLCYTKVCIFNLHVNAEALFVRAYSGFLLFAPMKVSSLSGSLDRRVKELRWILARSLLHPHGVGTKFLLLPLPRELLLVSKGHQFLARLLFASLKLLSIWKCLDLWESESLYWEAPDELF